MTKICKHCGTSHNLRGNDCRVCKDGLYRYGMTRNTMLELHESQNKKCHLCETDLEMFNGHKGGMVDHDHVSNKVRGILCNKCNTLVGGLENHPNIERLLKYIGM